MRHSYTLKSVLFVVVASSIFYWLADAAVMAGTFARMPGWWGGERPTTFAIYSWYQSVHGVTLALLSAPIAFSIRWLGLPRPVLLAFLVATLGLVAPMAIQRSGWPIDAPVARQAWAALGYVKFFGILPLVTWVVCRAALSNNSFKPKPLRGSA